MALNNSFPPHQAAAQGDERTLFRCAREDGTSKFFAAVGGSTFASLGFGNAKFNYDDAEGWAPRINFHGSSPAPPFDDVSGTNHGVVEHPSKSGLASLRRKNTNSAASSTSTSARVLELNNQRGSAGLEIFTTRYHNISGSQGLIGFTPSDATWKYCWYARKSSSAGSSGTVRMTGWIFGVAINGSEYIYNFSGHNIVNAGSSTSLTNPATGGTSYFRQITLTTSWTKYEMYFTLNGDTDIIALTTRFDNDDGSNSITKVYIDRPTLHPVNVKFVDNEIQTGTDAELSAAFTASYAT